MSGRWMAAACVVLALAGGVFWGLAWLRVAEPPPPRPLLEGRVALRGLDGGEFVPERVDVRIFDRETLQEHLVGWLAGLEQERAGAEASLAEARRHWEDCNFARREAARVVQVAERLNTADLAVCRERLTRAEDRARHAYDRLEHLTALSEGTADASALLDILPAPQLAGQADAAGRFSLELPPGRPLVLVLSAPPPHGGNRDRFVWLRPLPADGPLEFSNGTLVTFEHVRQLLSSR